MLGLLLSMPPHNRGYEMELSSKFCRAYGYCIWVGFGLMNFALFLHPMNPEDFLALVLSAPSETMLDAYGIQAAVLFWISVTLISSGLIGLVGSIKFFQKPTLLGGEITSKHRVFQQ
jgi:hypothetical protein